MPSEIVQQITDAVVRLEMKVRQALRKRMVLLTWIGNGKFTDSARPDAAAKSFIVARPASDPAFYSLRQPTEDYTRGK